MGPHGDLGRSVNESKVTRLAFPSLAISAVRQLNIEERVIVSRVIILRPSGELLVCRHKRRSDVVCEEMGLGVDVEEANNVVMADNSSASLLRKGLSGDDLPVVVGVVVAVTRDLLTLRTDAPVVVLQGIPVGMRVQEHLGVFVTDSQSIVVMYFCPYQERQQPPLDMT